MAPGSGRCADKATDVVTNNWPLNQSDSTAVSLLPPLLSLLPELGFSFRTVRVADALGWELLAD